MNSKILLFDEEARQKLAVGADKLARAVTVTLGPRSGNVAIDRQYPGPQIVKDGATVAKSIKLKDPVENMGAVMLREAALRSNDLAGDGTTTATLLANTLIQGGMKLVGGGIIDGVIQVNRVQAMALYDQLMAYIPIICTALDKMKKPVKTLAQKEQVATISAANAEIGKLVAEAVHKIGPDGLVMIENNTTGQTEIEYQKGMEFDEGYISPYFMTNTKYEWAEYGEGYVLLTDLVVADGMELVPIIEQVVKEGQNQKPLLIVAEDVVGPALAALVNTKLRIQAPIVAVRAPEFAERRRDMLEDMAILTGGVVITRESGKKLADVKLGDLGKVRNLKVTSTTTAFAPLNPDEEEITERANSIKEKINNEESDFRREKLKKRLAKLVQGVAIIKVGGASELEVGEKYERVQDAVHATKAAAAEGIVPGGGVALFDVATELKGEGPAYELIKEMCFAPVEKILENAGIDKGIVSDKPGTGIDVVTGKEIDMFEAGVVDPAKVTRLAVTNAISVAATFLTTQVGIVDDPDDEKPKVQ